MLVIFPLLAFVAILIFLVNFDSRQNWRRSFLRALLLWGGWLVASTEVLSLVHFITQAGLLIAWLLPAGACVAGLVILRRRGRLIWHPELGWLQGWQRVLLTTIILLVLVITALVAAFAPPNTSESLHYHMGRVAHWAQGKSVAHFATAIEIQNSFPGTAEYAILHLYVLTSSDRLVNFIEWFAMLGSIVGVSLLAEMLGAGIMGQLLAAIFAATLPMGIVQASSTMNDYIVSLWVVCAAAEFLHLLQDKDAPRRTVFFMALAAGLGISTKLTAAIFLCPFALLTPIILFRKVRPTKFFALVVLTLIVCALLNAGYTLRNLKTYHSLIDLNLTEIHSNELHSIQGLLSNILRNAGMQASTPWGEVNYQITRLIVGVHFKMGLDVNDPRITSVGEFWVRPINTSENLTPNPVHTWLMPLIFLVTLVRLKVTGKQVLIYQLLVIGGYLVFSFVFKWQVFGSRYLLPFFVLYAPAMGLVFSKSLPQWLCTIVGVAFAVAASLWLVSIQTRPLVSTPKTTTFGSLLTGPREQFYFATFEDYYPSYKNIAEQIKESGCTEVGLYLSGGTPEYVWWVLLGAPRSHIRLEWLVGGPSYEHYADQDFTPCAIISDADAVDSLRGLPLAYSEGYITLYMSGEEK